MQSDPENLWKRAAIIEARTKMAATLARSGVPAAEPHAAAALQLIQRTELEPTNAVFRSFFATMFAELGRAYATAAELRGITAAERRRRWTVALDHLSKGEAIWKDLDERRILPASEAEIRAQTRRAILQGTTALQ